MARIPTRPALVRERVVVDDGRGGSRIEFQPRPGPAEDQPYWPVQVSQPGAVERLAADNAVAELRTPLYFPLVGGQACPVARHDVVYMVDELDGPWRVESVVRPSAPAYVRADCLHDQDEGEST